MKAQDLISKMREQGLIEAANLLESKSKVSDTSIRIYDSDDKAYESGLADFLQNNTRWFNHPRINCFVACFDDHKNIEESCEHGGLC